MKFARVVFLIAGIYGLLILIPDYFNERLFSIMFPPALTHAEFYYGFIGAALAWQLAFLIIGQDPIRYRPLMLAAVIEKFSYGFACVVLLLQHRLSVFFFATACIDVLLGVLFIAAYLKTPKQLRS